MGDLSGHVRLLTCPWKHTLTWPNDLLPYPTECPAKVASTADEWGSCGKTLTPGAQIWATYEIGQEASMTPSEDYLDAAQAVQEWIDENGHR